MTGSQIANHAIQNPAGLPARHAPPHAAELARQIAAAIAAQNALRNNEYLINKKRLSIYLRQSFFCY
jgi:hypothetical protein